MRRLLLLRHAKAENGADVQADFDRALAPRGRDAAPLVGRHIANAALEPERILCSSAVRTRQTALLAAAEFRTSPDITFLDELYNAELDDYIEQIRLHGGDAETLMVVAHNPATEEAIHLLAGAEGEITPPIDVPTAALAILDFDGSDWTGIRQHSGRLVGFVRPRDLE